VYFFCLQACSDVLSDVFLTVTLRLTIYCIVYSVGILNKSHINLLELYNTLALPSLLYGSENWTIKQETQDE